MTIDIHHDEQRQRFHADVEGGEARLDYERKSEDVVDFRSTFVPDEARGEGIAGRIVTQGLEWASENDLRVVPSCSYVRGYIERNPEYESLVARD
ncbi:MAG: GNAT family N-acetyltransferase [Gemmatimonadota bacterium]|nr:GNAT family N-acetyltransferase [Gemmatimonadota bacterium]